MALALAENPRTRTKAAIKRGTQAAQRKMNRIDRSALHDLRRVYQAAREDVEARIRTAADVGGVVQLRHLRGLRDQLEARLSLLSQERDDLLFERMDAAAATGTAPFAEILSGGQLREIADGAVRFVRTFVDENGLQLSDRLWRLDAHAKQIVSRSVERAVIEGHSASQAAQEFLRRGVDVPANIRAKIGAAAADKIAREAGAALMQSDGNPYQNALRVFRTELNRAHGEAYKAAGFEVPGVIGTRFLLSPAHPEPDECDMHAKVNRYGLGPGVYPKGKSPWPAHPNTLSYEVVVFEDEVSAADKAGKEDRINWLNKQEPAIQEAVLNSRAKAAALRRGLLRENEIRTPWKVLRPRLEKQGFVSTNITGARDTPNDTPGAKLRRVRPVGVSVREGMDVRGNKRVLEDALGAIDAVHGDGRLPKIPVLRTAGTRRLGGYWHTGDGRAVKITISSRGSHPGMTAVHEIGHFLDHQAMFEPGRFATHFHDRLMGGWIEIVTGTRAVKQLRGMLQRPPSVLLPDGRRWSASREHLSYMLRVHELWARAYAQYITVRSGNLRLVGELTEQLATQERALIKYPYQWEPDDFAPVATAIDEVLEKLGWRVTGGR